MEQLPYSTLVQGEVALHLVLKYVQYYLNLK